MLKTLSLLYSRHVFFRGPAVLAEKGFGHLHQSMDCSTGAPNTEQSDLYCSLGPCLEIPFSPQELKGVSMRKVGKPRGSSCVPGLKKGPNQGGDGMAAQIERKRNCCAQHRSLITRGCVVDTSLAYSLGSR